jgi:hypothetical protein
MRKSWNALLVLLLTLPAYGAFGQEPAAEQPADTPPADAAPADQVPAGQAPADSGTGGDAAAPAPGTDAVVNSISNDAAAESPAEAPPADQAAAAPAEETPSTPWHLYGGGDWVRDTLSSSALRGFGQSNYDTGMYRLRAGARVFDAVGVEGQLGVNRNESGTAGTTAETSNYYGLFLVPTASLFETVELAFPVGYARTGVKHVGGSAHLSSVSYGLNAELPLRVFSAGLPDVRFVAGWMIYYQKTDARIYGFNAGLRYDFDVNHGGGSSSGPGVGEKIEGFFKSLWPFGKKDEAAPAQ